MAIPCLEYSLSSVLTFKHPQKIKKNRKKPVSFQASLLRGTKFCTTFMYIF